MKAVSCLFDWHLGEVYRGIRLPGVVFMPANLLHRPAASDWSVMMPQGTVSNVDGYKAISSGPIQKSSKAESVVD